MMLDPLLILCFGLVTVIVLIVCLRVNPFIALLAAALVVSFCSPLDSAAAGTIKSDVSALSAKVDLVAKAFGDMAGRIGILLAFGAIIGTCMSESGAADRIVRQICHTLGPKRVPQALLGSGFILSIPVFYDVTFYLLLPLAKSVYRSTRKHYILYLLVIGFGATLSHTLVPPTPGPLLVAETLGIPIGTMMFFGAMTGALLTPFAFAIAILMDRLMPSPVVADDSPANDETCPPCKENNESQTILPSFIASIIPIVLPVMLIATGTFILSFVLQERDTTALTSLSDNMSVPLQSFFRSMLLLANPQIALMLGAFAAAIVLYRVKKLKLRQMEQILQHALLEAGMIILITSAGGAFGAMLRHAGVGTRIEDLTLGMNTFGGSGILILAFATAAMIKTAQGSSTTAMITTSSIFAAMNLGAQQLGFHPAYLAVVIGLGSCVTGWMNDSGFCIFSRMSGIRETDALKTWTVGLVLLGISGLIVVLLCSTFLPFATL